MRSLLVVVCLVAACPRTTEATHREGARRILENRCGLCHLPDSGDPEFRGLAIGVFDLTVKDWSASLSDAQLDEAVRKLVNDGAPDAEVRALEHFVADELKWRDSHAADYPALMRDSGLIQPPPGP